MWTAWSKKSFCNGILGQKTNFQDIWLSSKSWILDIRYAISTIKMKILNQFFRKMIHYIVDISVPSFHQPARSSSFFLAFCLRFYGTTFYGWPYIFGPMQQWNEVTSKSNKTSGKQKTNSQNWNTVICLWWNKEKKIFEEPKKKVQTHRTKTVERGQLRI